MTISHNIIEHAKRMYPKGISYKGNLTDKQIQSIQEKCDIDWNILANGEKRYTIFYREMTKEEAKLVLDNARPQTKEIDRQFYDDEDLNNALDMAIKALEQQPSDDCVSREQAKIDVIPNSLYTSEQVIALLDNLSSVTPTRKVGKWIYDKASQNWRCSVCNETPKTLGYVGTSAFMTEHFKFCNHCGAEMRGAENE